MVKVKVREMEGFRVMRLFMRVILG